MKWIKYLWLPLLLLPLSACKDEELEMTEEFPYYEQKLSQNDVYNTELYYWNKLDFQIADPSVIYIDEGDQEGYFYAYGTSDDIRVYGFQSWRSKDLTNWEAMGVAYKPDFNNTWATVNYWAPEVIYDESDGLYYMFYSAQSMEDGTFHLSVAYADSPQGPFITPDNIRNGNGELLSADRPVYNLQADNPAIDPDIVRLNVIDISPFIDPNTGDKYIYFSYYDTFNQSEIFGMKMDDWFTPDYSTLTQLTAVGFLTVEAGRTFDVSKQTPEGTINEGPYMIYEHGRYYLTLSVYGFTDEKYQVRQALGDSPLGTFEKIRPEDGGTVLATDPSWSHLTSAGHHVFFQVGDERFIAYHTFFNRTDISEGRALAVDHVEFVDYDGTLLLHANGPTDSLQPLPEELSGYRNIAKDAMIESTNTASGSDVAYLNDGVMAYLTYDTIPEYRADEGVTTITLTWDDWVNARAILIYNSIHYEDSFLEIARITMTYLADDDGTKKQVKMTGLAYDWDWLVDGSFGTMNPGGAIIAEFDDITINEITITFASVAGYQVGIPEIVVLGNDDVVGPISSFDAYSYDPPIEVNPELVQDGSTIGSNHGLSTQFGYDLTHDDGTEDAYITQQWPFDQYAYFKDIYSTSFYVEAEFTVTNQAPYANDPFPKFGLTIATTENTIFYFVDADPSYTRDSIGVAQRTFDNRDWDWNTTEQNVAGTGISYKNGDYVKLAIIRDGDKFYMLANDELYIFYDQFNIFVENYAATVGFLTFNTEVRIQHYFATDDALIVAEKMAQYESQLNGEVFGTAEGYKTTSGWDLSTDTSTSSYVNNTATGDQYLYFKGFSGQTFYAETDITVLQGLGDPYPKFGIVLRSDTHEYFFYIDANTAFTQQQVGYVMKVDGNWDWGNSQTIPVSGISYRDGNYTSLGVHRNGTTVGLYVDGQLITELTNVVGLDDTDTVVGILSFTTSVQVTNYRLLTDETLIDAHLEQYNTN